MYPRRFLPYANSSAINNDSTETSSRTRPYNRNNNNQRKNAKNHQNRAWNNQGSSSRNQRSFGTQTVEGIESTMKIRKIEGPEHVAHVKSGITDAPSRKINANEGNTFDVGQPFEASESAGKIKKQNGKSVLKSGCSSNKVSIWKDNLSVASVKLEQLNLKDCGIANVMPNHPGFIASIDSGSSAPSSDVVPQDVLKNSLNHVGYWKQGEDQQNAELGRSSDKFSNWRESSFDNHLEKKVRFKLPEQQHPQIHGATSGFISKSVKLEMMSSENVGYNFAEHQKSTGSTNYAAAVPEFAEKSIKVEVDDVGFANSSGIYGMNQQLSQFAHPKNVAETGGVAETWEQLREEQPTTSGTMDANGNESAVTGNFWQF
ncbi:unnamed protein product [Caenorhabditis angaria]|uniref:Uncharacterized protein n=1 Tax=Caenorhabditis angaria TaxID=860376 RepID=A0A9P1NA00_9PELO|nr:unnamed protein product [Caenorhabditis angaria]